ncbi:endonuclease/exonuclease/phosphatase family protein [Trichocoleus sp. DQ-U1]|uniref:endonuclease/exonuclease/phosphatase family protein n=1 Tax=Trichocoleus sp. DQ-U1 TaxID=2933926 RepID=UPI003296C504
MAPTTLAAGDIAIIGFNFDDPDQLAFVLLKDIASGTAIHFTNKGWQSSNEFRKGEGTLTWTANRNYSVGEIVNPDLGSMKLSSDGDQILAYQGLATAPTFIYAINSNDSAWAENATSNNNSALPPGLTNGLTAVSIPEIDNATYNITNGTFGTRAELLAKISNPANWTGNNTQRLTMPTSAFTVTNTGSEITESLSLTVDSATFSEAAGAGAATGTVTRTGDLSKSLTINLLSSDTSEATVATTVTIPANQASATFAIDAVNDPFVEGSQTVTLTASATQYISGTITVTVTDDELEAGNLRIHDIQGASHTSPLVGQLVSKVPGIVTAVKSNGFYLQDPNPDTNDATSEGIFVLTWITPKVSVGDSILVSGIVDEFIPSGSDSSSLSTTQVIVGNAGIATISKGNPLPNSTILGEGGRTIPTQVIDDDGLGIFNPTQDGIDFYESLEGMRVQVNNAVAVGPTNDFGEIPVLADNGVNASTRTDRGGIVVQPGDFNPERIIIDDAIINGEPQVNVGDTFTGSITGVIDYSFGNYKLLNTAPLPNVISGNLARETTALTGSADQLTVASFNVENLNPADDNAKFSSLANIVINNLKLPDIISLEEIQDNNGATNDSVIDANQTYQTLIDAIASLGGATYQYRQINPVDDQDGGQPGGNIRVGFLFNPNRVEFVDRPSGTSITNTTVNSGTDGVELSASPGRILDTNLSNGDAFANSRKPLVGEFLFKGNQVFVIGNHFNSKGGDQPLFGSSQPPTLTSEAQRLQQAATVNNFVDSLLAIDPNANVIVLGDFNDFQFSKPLEVLKGNDLTNLIDTLPKNEQYTYIFEGNSQALDHILVSKNLNSTAEIDVVHLNAEFATQDSDHDPLVARFTLPINGNASSNTLVGSNSNNRIDGKAGNDTLIGLQGNDILTGGGDQDIFVIRSGDDIDTITDFGGVGTGNHPPAEIISEVDTLKFEGAGLTANNLLLTQTGNDLAIAFDGVDNTKVILKNFTLQDFNNLQQSTGASVDIGNILFKGQTQIQKSFEIANANEDLKQIFNKNTVAFLNDLDNNTQGFDASNDVINGQGGNDTLEGLGGDDLLRGGIGKDTLLGGEGNDYLAGGDGDDWLNGGIGQNTLFGGNGSDRFVVSNNSHTNTILDFTDTQDLIVFSDGLKLEYLTITQGTGANANNALIGLADTGELLATLTGVQANTLTSDDFTTI